jgi:hypothetical protein
LHDACHAWPSAWSCTETLITTLDRYDMHACTWCLSWWPWPFLPSGPRCLFKLALAVHSRIWPPSMLLAIIWRASMIASWHLAIAFEICWDARSHVFTWRSWPWFWWSWLQHPRLHTLYMSAVISGASGYPRCICEWSQHILVLVRAFKSACATVDLFTASTTIALAFLRLIRMPKMLLKVHVQYTGSLVS